MVEISLSAAQRINKRKYDDSGHFYLIICFRQKGWTRRKLPKTCLLSRQSRKRRQKATSVEEPVEQAPRWRQFFTFSTNLDFIWLWIKYKPIMLILESTFKRVCIIFFLKRIFLLRPFSPVAFSPGTFSRCDTWKSPFGLEEKWEQKKRWINLSLVNCGWYKMKSCRSGCRPLKRAKSFEVTAWIHTFTCRKERGPLKIVIDLDGRIDQNNKKLECTAKNVTFLTVSSV